MSSKTSSIGLTIWNDTDPVDFEEINSNFKKIDGLVNCIESGIATASYEGGVNNNAEWYYKKYSDGTVDMSAVLYYDSLKCDGGTEAPYYSADKAVNFPFALSKVYDVQMNLVSGTSGWLSNVTDVTILTNVTFRLFNMIKETETDYKKVFINVKGKLAE